MAEFIWLLIIGTSIWVVVDAKSIGVKSGQMKGLGNMGPWGWFFACLLFWIVGFPLYLTKRDEFKRINSAPAPPITSHNARGMKKCPFCAEDIQNAAIVCKHCRRELAATPNREVGAQTTGASEHLSCPSCKARVAIGSTACPWCHSAITGATPNPTVPASSKRVA